MATIEAIRVLAVEIYEVIKQSLLDQAFAGQDEKWHSALNHL
jgi:hypothetical protein